MGIHELIDTMIKKDLPNWASFLLSALVIPLFAHWWNHRSVGSIPNFDISFGAGNITMHGAPYQCLTIRFSNHTGSRVYLSNARLARPTARFRVAPGADRDVYSDSYILRFPNPLMQYVFLEVALDLDQTIETVMALTEATTEEMTAYRPPCWRKYLKAPRYFFLRFDATRGKSRYSVCLPY